MKRSSYVLPTPCQSEHSESVAHEMIRLVVGSDKHWDLWRYEAKECTDEREAGSRAEELDDLLK